MPLVGIWGLPYLPLDELVDEGELDAVHEEICLGLGEVETGVTGGSLRWMGVAAPWVMNDGYRDLGFVIERMTDEQWLRFVALGDSAEAFEVARRREYAFGDETDHPLTRRQERWLAHRFGVYFPWTVVYHLLENERWEDIGSGAGKRFGAEAERVFPRTVSLIRSLPFAEIGRCLIFGLAPDHHATVHRDSEPGATLAVAQSISLCPGGDKRFFVTGGPDEERIVPASRVYWFNDMDWHGVEPDPWFRYSIRVDGRFRPAFLKELRRRHGR